MERVGPRLQLRRAQATAGDIVPLYGDESEALTHPYLVRRTSPFDAHAWAERGVEPRVQAPGQARKVTMSGERERSTLGVSEAVARTALVHTSPTKRSADFVAPLERLDRAYGPVSERTRKPVVLVLDNGPIHTSRTTRKALAERPWITVEWLPRHAPELDPIERTWRDLKRHHLAHRAFRDAGDLDRAIHEAIAEMNRERAVVHPCHILPRAAQWWAPGGRRRRWRPRSACTPRCCAGG